MPNHYDEEGNIPGPGEPQYDEIYRKENWAGRPLKNLSILGLAVATKKPIESAISTATSSILEHFFPDDDNTVIPPYSSGAVVQTKDGTLYRPEKGTMTSTFMSTQDSEDEPIPQWKLQENYALEDALEGFPVMTTTGKLNSKFNPYLTHAERKGWQPVPSPEELKRRGNLGRTWQHIDADERKKNYKPEKIRRRKGETEAEFSNRLYNAKFDAAGLTEDAKFALRNMLDAKTLNQEQRRIIKMGISNPNFSPQKYRETREALVEEFLDGFEFLGIKPSEVEAHHIAGLRQTAQLYEGLNRDEFPEMLKQMYKAGLVTGNDPNNLMAIIREGHYPSEDHPDITAVHEYLTEELGLYNQKLTGDFGVDIRDLSVEERIPIIQEYAKVVKRSYKVAEIAIRKAIDKRVQKDSPEAAAHAALDIQEYELSKSELDSIKSKIDEHLKFELTKPNYEALADSVFGGESAAESMRRRGIRPGKETSQLQLIKKPPRKKRTRKTDPTLGQVGSGWDITTQENDMEILFPDDDD